jgi:hypothetical protein
LSFRGAATPVGAEKIMAAMNSTIALQVNLEAQPREMRKSKCTAVPEYLRPRVAANLDGWECVLRRDEFCSDFETLE